VYGYNRWKAVDEAGVGPEFTAAAAMAQPKKKKIINVGFLLL